MSSINYNGDVINSTVDGLNSIIKKFPSLSEEIKKSTNKLVTARGFQQYVANISSDTFSKLINSCEVECNELVHSIRQKQVDILGYTQDNEAIKVLLDKLSVSDYDTLDLKPIESHITVDRKVINVVTGAGSSAVVFILGLAEGIAEFGETALDMLDLGVSAAGSIFVSGDELENYWAETRARVSEEHVKSLFDSLYSDNVFLSDIEANAYGGSAAREIGKGLGYAAGIIGTSALTGGITGAGAGVAGFSANALRLGSTAAALGFSKNTEEAWNNGANTFDGLLYGAVSGAWEGVQWYFGAKINAVGGPRLGSELFRGGSSAALSRIALSSADAGAEGIVQPALSMIYKDYGQGDLVSNFKMAFDEAGGAENIFKYAAMGAVGGSISEGVEMAQGLASVNKQKMVIDSNVAGSSEVVFREKAYSAFKEKYPELVAQYGDDFVDKIPISDLKRLNALENSESISNAASILGVDTSSLDREALIKTTGYKRDIATWLINDVRYTGTDIDEIAEKMANEIFASNNLSKIRANNMAISGDIDGALRFIPSGSVSEAFDRTNASIKLFRSLETYATATDTKKYCVDLLNVLTKDYGMSIEAAGFEIQDIYLMATYERGCYDMIVTIGDKQVTICIPNDYRISSNGLTIDEFVEYLKNTPEELRPYIGDNIYYYDTFSIKDITDYTSQGKYPRINDTYYAGLNSPNNSIEIFAHGTSEVKMLRETITHEIAHNIDRDFNSFGKMKYSTSNEWALAMEADMKTASGLRSVSSYGATDVWEDFAESVRFYYHNRAYMDRYFPNRVKLIEDYLGIT